MVTLFDAPKQRSPLWAHPEAVDRNILSWTRAFAAALLIVVGAVYAIATVDFSVRSKPMEKQPLSVRIVALAPEPKQEAPKKEEPKPPEPKPTPKASPKKIQKVVTAPPKVPPRMPEPESKPLPEAAPIAMAPPVPGPSTDRAASIPSTVAPLSSPAKNPNGGTNEIRQGVASLVACKPEYPSRAREKGIGGEFVVHMAVDPSGTVTDVKIVSGNPRGIFERDIKRSMSRCKFEPTSTGFIAEAPVVFRLED